MDLGNQYRRATGTLIVLVLADVCCAAVFALEPLSQNWIVAAPLAALSTLWAHSDVGQFKERAERDVGDFNAAIAAIDNIGIVPMSQGGLGMLEWALYAAIEGIENIRDQVHIRHGLRRCAGGMAVVAVLAAIVLSALRLRLVGLHPNDGWNLFFLLGPLYLALTSRRNLSTPSVSTPKALAAKIWAGIVRLNQPDMGAKTGLVNLVDGGMDVVHELVKKKIAEWLDKNGINPDRK